MSRRPAVNTPDDNDVELTIFAFRSFRDVADGDYIAARMAYRAGLQIQYHWASQQAIEKYLKCILLLNRVPAKDVMHSLAAAVTLIEKSGAVQLGLTERARNFIRHVDQIGRFRYLEVSTWVDWHSIIQFDQTVWELRRLCTVAESQPAKTLVDGKPAPRVRIPGGFLERVLDKKPAHKARGALLWQNGSSADRGLRFVFGVVRSRSTLRYL